MSLACGKHSCFCVFCLFVFAFYQPFCVCVCHESLERVQSSQGRDDSPLLPPCCCVPSFLPSLLSSASPRAFWDVAYHATQLSFSQYVGAPAKRRLFPSRFPSFFLFHPPSLTHTHTHALSNTHKDTHTSSLCLHSRQSK